MGSKGGRYVRLTTLPPSCVDCLEIWAPQPPGTLRPVRHVMGLLYLFVGGVAQSVWRLATGWTVRGLNPGGGEIFLTSPDRPWGPLSLLYNGYRVFPGGRERPVRYADPSPHSSAVVMKGQSYNFTPPMGRTGPQCLYKGALYLYFFKTILLCISW